MNVFIKSSCGTTKKANDPHGVATPRPAQGGWGPAVPGRWGPKYTIHCV